MNTYKIKLEDKAAFLNRLEKLDVKIDSYEVKDNKLGGYFEVNIENPEVNNIIKTILRQSPKINRIKETLRKLVREELKRK
jgi:ribosomal protein S6